ncbi:MAG: nucleotidyltransferase family protein, partial [Anaerovoracaceae bacterium]
MESGKVVAIILAGGLSSRMKAFKPLLPIGGEPALLVAVKGFRAAGIKTIYVVTGHQRELLAPLIAQEGLIEVYNQDYEKGMFSSIGAGIAAAKNAEGGILLLPVDCPLVFPEVIKRVLAAATEKNMVVPCYLGKKGHPLYLPQRYVERILAHDGKHGLKGVLEPLEQELIRVDGGREGVLLDMDDQAGYEEILR